MGAAGVVGPGSFLLEVLVGILDLLVKRHGTHFLMENVLERRGKAEWKREACL